MKPKDPIWGLYDLVVENGKTTAKCKDCNTSISAKSDHLKHINKNVVQNLSPTCIFLSFSHHFYVY